MRKTLEVMHCHLGLLALIIAVTIADVTPFFYLMACYIAIYHIYNVQKIAKNPSQLFISFSSATIAAIILHIIITALSSWLGLFYNYFSILLHS